jgi:hypothetical protein
MRAFTGIVAAATAALLMLSARASAQLTVDFAQTVDVTPSGFSVVWESSSPADPGIAIFADPAGTVDITSEFERVFYPFQAGDPSAANEVAQADYLDALRAATRNRGLAKVRVQGGTPGATYYYRVSSANGGDTATFPDAGGTTAVTLMSENSFLTESPQLLITVLGDEAAGALIAVGSAEALHGLAGFVGDGAGPGHVFVNLSQMFTGPTANWNPTGIKTLDLSIRRGAGQTSTGTVDIDFAAGFAVGTTYPVNFGGVVALVTLLQPAQNLYTTGQSILISWQDNFPTPGATVSLYYDTDNTGEDGTLIVSGLDEATDGAGDSFMWDTTGLSDGAYFVYAIVSDGTTTGASYGAGKVTVDRNQVSADGDSMSDLWESFYFGDTARDGTADFDGDGLFDAAEFADGTNPAIPDIRLALRRGLNLIALPLNAVPAMNSTALLDRIGMSAVAVSRVAANVVETTSRGTNGIEGPVFPIAGGEGYYIDVTDDYEAVWSGTAIANARDLTSGVNLIGFVSVPDGYSASALLQAIGDATIAASVRRFNRETGRFETVTYVEGQSVGPDFDIERGTGYVIDMKSTVPGFEP